MEWAVKTHVGKIRSNNEDSFYIDEDEQRIFIVADGMGGHNAGEVASKMAINIASEYIKSSFHHVEFNDFKVHRIIREAIEIANRKVYQHSLLQKECDGMGTTITSAIILNNKIYIGHIGDSRAYLLTDSEFNQITEDHTLVSELVKNGSITETEAKNHPKRNIITKALGTDSNIEPDLLNLEINNNNILILCSDGLTNVVDDNELENTFRNSKDLQKGCDYLVELANNRGGYDNITIIAIRYRRS